MTPKSPTSDPGGQSPDSSTKTVIITESTDPKESSPLPKTSTTPTSTRRGSAGKGEFKPLPFLYRTLLGIFIVEAVFLGFTYKGCMDLTKKQGSLSIQDHCPRVAERSDNLFGVAVATVLSLMTGQAVESFRSKKD